MAFFCCGAARDGLLRVTPPNESFITDRITGFCLNVPSHRQGQVFQMMPFSGEASALRPVWSSHYDHSVALPLPLLGPAR